MNLLPGGHALPRVGFILNPHMWPGGRNYFRNLLIAVGQLPDPSVAPIIISGRRGSFFLPDLPPFEIVKTRMMDRGTLPWLVRKVIANFSAGDRLLYRLLRRHRVAVLSHHKPLVLHSPM